MANTWCMTDGKEPTMDCWVRDDHKIVQEQLYTDGSIRIRPAEPLREILYDGTPETRMAIHDWMIASALNPMTPFGYQQGFRLDDGSPGIEVRPGDTVTRVGGLFGVRRG